MLLTDAVVSEDALLQHIVCCCCEVRFHSLRRGSSQHRRFVRHMYAKKFGADGLNVVRRTGQVIDGDRQRTVATGDLMVATSAALCEFRELARIRNPVPDGEISV